MPNASGLAASIRGSVESSTFDLAGQNVRTIETNITNAFQDPLPVSDMIRITFITGAGKLGRQKYDADAAKAVTSALRALGFDEDRGASCVKECAGFWKMQHDTGKNLKTVVVFPRISLGDDEAGENSSQHETARCAPIYAKGGVEDMIASSSINVFKGMMTSKCPSWSEKKGCMTAIAGIKSKLTELEQKLLTGTPLTDAEQDLYDSVSADSLEEKQNMAKDMMHQQVDDGKISSREKTQLLSQVNDRLETVSKEIAQANNDKKVEKMKGVKQKLEARKVKLSSITPQQPHKLKHQAGIVALRTELQPLLELEDGAGGRLLSLKETKSLARKDEILEEIAELEANSRGWFEDDESFELRLESCNAAWSANSKKSGKKGSKKGNPSSSSSSNAWVASSSVRLPRGAKPKNATKTTSKKSKGTGGVFAAMMIDSDSD